MKQNLSTHLFTNVIGNIADMQQIKNCSL